MNLQDFCAKDEQKQNRLSKPFSHGKYSFASDGHMLIRVPRLLEVTKGLPDFMESKFTEFVTGDCLTPIPDYEQEKKKCSICRGTGKVEECPECKGIGEVYFQNIYNDYEFECLTCNGHGEVSGGKNACEECEGTGQVYADRWAGIDIGNKRIGLRLLDKIKELPGVMLGNCSGDDKAPVMFRFDGGDGLLMPMTK